jgi:manganese/zinc/iron transport system permease protein
MTELVPAFDFRRVFVAPWTTELTSFGWIGLMGFFVTAACALVGNYLILRRMALIGDAVSHSVLPGIVIAFLLANSRGTLPMFIGALAAGGVTTLMIDAIHQRTRVKQDAAIGIAFSSLFAIGVLLTVLYAHQIDLDAECVLYGEIAFVPLEPYVEWGGWVLGPESMVRMGAVFLVFYRPLLITSFDPGLARSLGIRPAVVHFALMATLSIVVVSAFEAVGAILVIAMLILPGATASLLTERLSRVHLLSLGHAALSAWLGVSLGVWLESSIAAAMVVAGTLLFVLAWILAPRQGLVARWRQQHRPEAGAGAPEPSAADASRVRG